STSHLSILLPPPRVWGCASEGKPWFNLGALGESLPHPKVEDGLVRMFPHVDGARGPRGRGGFPEQEPAAVAVRGADEIARGVQDPDRSPVRLVGGLEVLPDHPGSDRQVPRAVDQMGDGADAREA